MKTYPVSLALASFSLVVVHVASAADQPAPPPPTPTPIVSPGISAPIAPIAPLPEFTSWDDIKTFTYEQRKEFVAGVGRLEAKLDHQIGELKAKRATMKNDPKEWDIAMRGLVDARSYLRSMVTEIDDVAPEMWISQKEKVQRALQSVQDAYDKVKTTTTS